jgi:RNA polymerase sigma-70 factor, ECF subfamily
MNAERGNGAFWEPGRSDEVDPTVFGRHRPLLFSVAYGMLGSVMDAEDAVVIRLCIDQLRSARARRAGYVGPWLPEPLLTERDVGESAVLDG